MKGIESERERHRERERESEREKIERRRIFFLVKSPERRNKASTRVSEFL